MKSSKKENDDLNKSSLKKRKFPGIQNLVDCNVEHDKDQTSMARHLRPSMISRPQKKTLDSQSENEDCKLQTKDSCNTARVQRTDQKGRRKIGTPTEVRNIYCSKMSVDCMGKEACEGIPFKKKTHGTKNLESIKMLINSIEKEAHEPVEKHNSVDIDAMNPKSLPFKFRFEDEDPSPPEKSEWEKEIDSHFCDLDMVSGNLRLQEFFNSNITALFA